MDADKPASQPQVKWYQTIAAVLLVLGVLWAAAYGLYLFASWAIASVKQANQTASAIMVATIVAGMAFIGNIYSQRTSAAAQRRQAQAIADRQLQETLREKKRDVYLRFLDAIFATINVSDISDEGKRQQALEASVATLKGLIPEMLVWSSAAVVGAWSTFRTSVAAMASGDSTGAVPMLLLLEDIINAIREELGLGRLEFGQASRFFINDFDDAVSQMVGRLTEETGAESSSSKAADESGESNAP